jgi:hypothetical protein
MALTDTRAPIGELADLVRRAGDGGEADIAAIGKVLGQIRAGVATADSGQWRRELIEEADRALAGCSGSGDDARHLETMLDKVRAACAEDDGSPEPQPAQAAQSADDETYPEILGDILIVGWW